MNTTEFIQALKDPEFVKNLKEGAKKITRAKRAPIQPLNAGERKQIAEAAEKLKARIALNNGDVLVRRAPIQPLDADEKLLLEESIKRLETRVKK